MEKMDSLTISNEAAESTLEIVQEKFLRGERILSLLEAYQIVGNEAPSRLLALVTQESCGTYAIFSFAVSRIPPKTFSDLTIDNIFPLNDDFRLTSGKDGIAELQFVIASTNIQSTFYYYPCSSSNLNDFKAFQAKVSAAEADYKWKVATTTDISGTSTTPMDYSWIKTYKVIEDYSDIDRRIADGSKPLRKGESKFQDELKKHEHEYIVYKKFRVYCATWNVNGQPSNDVILRAWLDTSDKPPDIYAIAFQELDLSPKAITFNETRPDPVWIRKIMDNLPTTANYEELVSVRLVGMMLTIIVRKELRPNVTRCWIQTVGTGALNIMGNKGGVGVSMTLNEANICFINSHLAAHVSEVERRNEDFAEIVRRLQFGDGFTKYTIDRHDHIFWIGDLNYRIHEMPGRILDYENFAELLKNDQLHMERLKNRVFEGYTEGEIKFRPTYKYDPGTDNWDSSEKSRAPAWCDRILWKGERIKQLTYNSVMSIRLSDHKPVYALFITGIKTKDEHKYKRVHEEVLKRVDKYENDNQPQITVEKTDIDFDVIHFNELSTRDFTVANNCHLPVKFSFKAKNENDKRICEDWLKVEPTCGELITGTSLSIRIKVFIDSYNASRLHKKHKDNPGKIPLDILVLDVEDGRDIFITIMGEYKPSCFGFSFDTLSRLESPVASLTLSQIMAIETSIETTPCIITMPRELFLLLDYLFKFGSKLTDLFSVERKYSKNPNINEVRDWLDVWSLDECPGTPHTVAEALLMLIESSPESLLHPFEQQLLHADNFESYLSILQQLSIPRKNAFLYLCLFLRDLIRQRIMNLHDIATVFASVLFKTKTAMFTTKDDEARRNFVARFLANDFSNFARQEIKLEVES